MAIRWRRPVSDCHPRVRGIAAGFPVRGCLPHLSRNCDHNLLAAMVGRVSLHGYTSVVPAADSAAGKTPTTFGHEVAHGMRALVAAGVIAPARPKAAALKRYLSRFPGPRALVLRAAYLLAGRRPLHKYKTFLKKELLIKMIDFVSDLVTARAIQNPDAATTVALGRWWLTIGEELKRQWHKDHRVVYASGLTARELGALADNWLRLPNWRAIENDCSRWDGRYGRACGALAIALLILWHIPEYVWKEETRASFTLVSDLATFIVAFCRLSGVGNTSVMNSWVDALIALLPLLIADPRLNLPFQLVVLGDDMLLFVLHAHPIQPVMVRDSYARFGHKPVCIQSTTQPLRPTFCSGRFFHSLVGRIWAPKPGRTLVKSAWVVTGDITPLAWLRCVGLSIAASASHVPIVRALARRYIELGVTPTPTEDRVFKRLKSTHVPTPAGAQECSPQGLLEFCQFYETTPGEIADVEAAIARMAYGEELDHPLVHRIVAKDNEVPTDPVDADATSGRNPMAPAHAAPTPQVAVADLGEDPEFPDAHLEQHLAAEAREYVEALRSIYQAHPSSRATRQSNAQ